MSSCKFNDAELWSCDFPDIVLELLPPHFHNTKVFEPDFIEKIVQIAPENNVYKMTRYMHNIKNHFDGINKCFLITKKHSN
jgi:hypothetical protein